MLVWIIKWWIIDKILEQAAILILLVQIFTEGLGGEEVGRRGKQGRSDGGRQDSGGVMATKCNWTIMVVFAFICCYNKRWIFWWSFYSFFHTAILTCAFIITSAYSNKDRFSFILVFFIFFKLKFMNPILFFKEKESNIIIVLLMLLSTFN